MPNEKMYECQKYTLHESIVIVVRFHGNSSVWVQFAMFKNAEKGSSVAFGCRCIVRPSRG